MAFNLSFFTDTWDAAQKKFDPEIEFCTERLNTLWSYFSSLEKLKTIDQDGLITLGICLLLAAFSLWLLWKIKRLLWFLVIFFVVVVVGLKWEKYMSEHDSVGYLFALIGILAAAYGFARKFSK